MILDNLNVNIKYKETYGLSLYQNKIPLIDKIFVSNDGKEDVDFVKLTITSFPAALEKKEISINKISQNTTVEIEYQDIELSKEITASLVSQIKMLIRIKLECNNEEKIIEFPLNLLPMDYWTGANSEPETIASFINKNNTSFSKIVKRGEELLGASSESSSFDGYQSNNQSRVLKQVAALFSSFKELDIKLLKGENENLILPQRIRKAEDILVSKEATVVELAVVFSSLLESIGLNPIVVIGKKTMLVGVWLKNKTFREILDYDNTQITKRLIKDIEEIVILNPLDLTNLSNRSFSESLTYAKDIVSDVEEFSLSVDIARARNSHILPMGNFVKEEKRDLDTSDLKSDSQREQGDINEEFDSLGTTNVASESVPKQKKWERKLLDLTLRNNLINLKLNKSVIPLMCHDIRELEDKISQGESFEVLSIPPEWSELINSNREESLKKSQIRELSKGEFDNKRIRASLELEELEKRGNHIKSQSKYSIEEFGANSLFLALGSLTWFEPMSDKERKAPLILVPVDIEVKNLKGYITMKPREEDAMFNITLLEMLKQDFGILINGLDPLPMDENGTDITKVLSIVTNAIRDQRKWDIKEEANIGIFSFGRFIMWADMKSNMEIFKKNEIVESLLTQKMSVKNENPSISSKYIEDDLLEKRIIFPLSSDFSQQVSVKASSEGQSFILYGPPGTGKSQTITNIIANALLDNKKVLFVAQKMAALEVVENKLNDLGIGAFCLELHSSKARKRDVLGQLEKALKIVKIKEPTEFKKSYDDTLNKRIELNKINAKLYEKDENKDSTFDLLVKYMKYKDTDKTVNDDNLPDNFNYDEALSAIKEMVKFGSVAGGPYRHPLNGVKQTEYSIVKKDELQNLTELDFNGLNEIYKSTFKEDLDLESMKDVDDLVEYIDAVTNTRKINEEIFSNENLETVALDLRRISAESTLFSQTRDELKSKFTDDIFIVNPDEALKEYNTALNQNIFGKLLRGNRVLKELNTYAKNHKVNDDNIFRTLETISIYKQAKVILKEMTQEYRNVSLLQDVENIDVVKLDALISEIEKINVLYRKVKRLEKENGSIQRVVTKYTNFKLSEDFSNQWKKLREGILKFNEITKLDETNLNDIEGTLFEKYMVKMIQVKESLETFKDWTIFNKAVEKVNDLGLSSFSKDYIEGRISEDEMESVFSKSVLKIRLNKKLEKYSDLLQLSKASLEEKVLRLKEMIINNRQVEKRQLYYQLASKIPGLVSNETTSKELALLQKAIKSSIRSLSVRKLFREIPNALSVLTPCMLMSPMSAAQYLDPSIYQFDLVIFDEASQLRTPEAIGALGRSKQVIIAGDPKQLPPSEFFMTNNTEEEFSEEEDLDNILEDCMALSMPYTHLTTHYRSRHESLIEFSNRKYYDNNLQTFPSPDDLISKVNLVNVDGPYDRGKTRTNYAEAVSVVDEIERRFMDEKLRKFSVGVVTFSSAQQNLVEEVLRKRYASNPEFEAISSSMAEPLFIRNLENVQGDERDVILFSIGYGVDETGKISLNFGPLNQDGGWRRLNVAVTRSRYEMVVFTNINPENFNVPLKGAKGVSDLKDFLSFAKNHNRVVNLKAIKQRENEVSLSEMLADRLRERGYRINTNIGESEFRIDIGIVHPNDENRYILGVFCGENNAKNSKSAYDREILNKDILKGLGWNLEEVYILDFFENEEKEVDRIVKSIDYYLRNESKSEDKASETIKDAPMVENKRDADLEEETIQSNAYEKPYKLAFTTKVDMTLDEFMKVSSAKKVAGDVMKIIEVESPITDVLLSKRLKSLYSFSRLTDNMIKQTDMIINTVNVRKPLKIREGDRIVYLKDEDKDFKTYRKTLEEDKDRTLKDISLMEIKNAILDAVRGEGAISFRNLIKKALELLGYPHLNVENEMYMENIINTQLLEDEIKKNEEGYIVLER